MSRGQLNIPARIDCKQQGLLVCVICQAMGYTFSRARDAGDEYLMHVPPTERRQLIQ